MFFTYSVSTICSHFNHTCSGTVFIFKKSIQVSLPQTCLTPSVRSVPCSSQAFPSVSKWTQIFQGRLCYLRKQLVNSEGFSPGIQHRKINHTLPRVKNQPNPLHPRTLKKGGWEMNSLQTFCSLGLVSWPFHSEEEALPSWGLGTLGVAAPLASGTIPALASPAAPVASAQSGTSGTAAWGTNTCRFPRQLLLGANCQACLPWLCKHPQGLPLKQGRAAQSCLTCSSPSCGEVVAEGM